MARSSNNEAALIRGGHRWVRVLVIVLAVIAAIFATGAVLCTIY